MLISENTDKGVVLINDEGNNMGYIPHGRLSHLEPHSEEEEEVNFIEQEIPEGDKEEEQ